MTVKISGSAIVLVTGRLLSSALRNTAMSKTAIETLNLVVWDHRFELSVYCEIVFFGYGSVSY